MPEASERAGRVFWRSPWMAGLVLLLAGSIRAQEILPAQIFEIGPGVNGDSSAQFVTLRHGGEPLPGSLTLEFFDGSLRPLGELPLPADLPPGEAPAGELPSLLVATASFGELEGAPTLDVFLPPGLLTTAGGRVCLVYRNPEGEEIRRDCVSHGAVRAPAPLQEGDAAPGPGILGVESLRRFGALDPAAPGFQSRNADFRIETIQARNRAGEEFAGVELDAIAKGRNLFEKSTFDGNGRTCATCHRPEEGFALSPSAVESLEDDDDPLFVYRRNPALGFLEDDRLLTGGRALVKTHPDGFLSPAVFRAVPGLFQLEDTAPHGWSGDFATLPEMVLHCLADHLTSLLNRNSDLEKGPLAFREPTAAELEVLLAFLRSIEIREPLETLMASAARRGVDPEILRQGRDIFLDTGHCFQCHSGPALSDVDASLVESGVVPGPGNHEFNTGVALGFEFEELDPDDPPPDHWEIDREFNVPTLLGTALKGSFFHNNVSGDLEEALRSYCTDCTDASSARSPAAPLLADLGLGFPQLAAFVGSLVPPEPECVDGEDCNANGLVDVCEIALFPERDCDGNGQLDVCESPGNDCDGNQQLDSCEIQEDRRLDCNRDGVLDVCQIASGDLEDCDGDGRVDTCEPLDFAALSGRSPDREWVIDGMVKRHQIGTQATGIGDVNDDGFDDFCVVALRQPDGLTADAYVIFGSGHLADLPTDLRTLEPGQGFRVIASSLPAQSSWVSDVAAVGDLDGDGVDDFALGQSQFSFEDRRTVGRVLVIPGHRDLGAGGLVDIDDPEFRPRVEILGQESADVLGRVITGGGDLDGDGIDDLLLGTTNSQFLGTGRGSGKVFLILGSREFFQVPVLDLAIRDLGVSLWLGQREVGGRFGAEMAGVGDVDADGIDDFVVVASGLPTGGGNRGVSFLLFGGPHLRDPDRILQLVETLGSDRVLRLPEPVQVRGGVGIVPVGLGDVSGDGIADFLLATEQIHVILGSPLLRGDPSFRLQDLDGTRGYTILPPFSGANSRAGVLSDYTSDSLAEYFYYWQLSGEAHIRFGHGHQLLRGRLPYPGIDDREGLRLAGDPEQPEVAIQIVTEHFDLEAVGDVNGDGHDDLLVRTPEFGTSGASRQGRVRLVAGPFFPDDCNENRRPDTCELALGEVPDADGDLVPDDCQADSDGDGVYDRFDPCPDFAGGSAWNSDGDRLGDACDPCVLDRRDECDLRRSGSLVTDQAGGVIEAEDGSITLEVPREILTRETPISITGYSQPFSLVIENEPASALGRFIIGPADPSVVGPFLVTLTWSDADDDGIIDGTNLREANLVPVFRGELAAPRCRESELCSESDNVLLFEIFTTGEIVLAVLPPTRSAFTRGDASADGVFDISDAIFVLSHLFLGLAGETTCLGALDINDDEMVDTSDAIFALVSQFLGAGDPAPPFPGCGEDLTPGPLSCEAFPPCEPAPGE